MKAIELYLGITLESDGLMGHTSIPEEAISYIIQSISSHLTHHPMTKRPSSRFEYLDLSPRIEVEPTEGLVSTTRVVYVDESEYDTLDPLIPIHIGPSPPPNMAI